MPDDPGIRAHGWAISKESSMKLKKCRWCSCSEFVKVAVTDYPASLKYEAEYKCSNCTKHKQWVHRPKGDGPKPFVKKRKSGRSIEGNTP